MTLNINAITKAYGNNLAINQFSSTFELGIYALLGPNGSGKSTLMNILTDNLKADSGEITYTDDSGNTENVLHMGVRFREKLGFMPQYPGLYPNFTVERFMWYMAALKGIKKEEAKKQIPEILAAVELDDVPKRKIGALSGGMKQRLTLAQAVLGAPEILILDEPTAGLDPKQRIAIRNYISKIAFNKIVLIATHVVPDIEFIARDIIMLKKGVIVDNAPPHELTKKIERKVWNVPCAESDVQPMQDKFRVTNIARDEDTGKVLLRVLADEQPTDRSKTVAPTLEDYYLYVFGENSSTS
ncbi:ATP-binding cassette domain-containing protein [Frisingicoccus sp.]|uniref:ATP-binding cassette domain-containing protein n=1 Tax=Frisingicoccus sp. TaxID=1918627 RepID=UPI0025BBA9B1|nr:ATP-binding cassette domain-containing protein [Frisingicoccus sp.]